MFFHQKKGEGDLGEITGLMVLFRAVLSNAAAMNHVWKQHLKRGWSALKCAARAYILGLEH